MRLLFFVFVLIGSIIISSQYATGQTPALKFMTSSSFIDLADYFHVVGEIQNTSPGVLRFVEVIGTFYDATNRVVATSSTYTNPSDIGPGNKAPFDLTILSASVPVTQIYNYSLTATYQPLG